MQELSFDVRTLKDFQKITSVGNILFKYFHKRILINQQIGFNLRDGGDRMLGVKLRTTSFSAMTIRIYRNCS